MRTTRFDLLPDGMAHTLSRRSLLRQAGAVGLAAAATTTLGRRMALGGARQASPAASPAPDEASSYRFAIGDVTATLVSDGTVAFPNPTGILFANAPADALAAELRAHGAPEPWPEWTTPFTPLVLDAGGQRVLVDTGIGASAGPTAGRLRANLAAAGIAPETIDLVVLTHGHADHIGGLTDDIGALAFANARYAMGRTEWAFWTEPGRAELHLPASDFRDLMLEVAAANLPAIEGLVELIEDGAEIVPGIRAIAAPGHTPGHLVLDVTSGGERLLYGADTVLHPIHLEHPDWLTVFDTQPEPTVGTRRRILDLAATEAVLMSAYHIPFPGLGRVAAEGDVWRWETVTSAP